MRLLALVSFIYFCISRMLELVWVMMRGFKCQCWHRLEMDVFGTSILGLKSWWGKIWDRVPGLFLDGSGINQLFGPQV